MANDSTSEPGGTGPAQAGAPLKRSRLRLLGIAFAVLLIGLYARNSLNGPSTCVTDRNENVAVRALMEYVEAQTIYQVQHNGHATDLVQLRGLLDPAIEEATRPESAYGGYYFVPVNRGRDSSTQYALLALPAHYGQSGKFSFLVDERAIVMLKDDRGTLYTVIPPDFDTGGWISVHG